MATSEIGLADLDLVHTYGVTVRLMTLGGIAHAGEYERDIHGASWLGPAIWAPVAASAGTDGWAGGTGVVVSFGAVRAAVT
jgi:hypothetical protein